MKALRTPVGVWTRHRRTPLLAPALVLAGALALVPAALAGVVETSPGTRSLVVGTATMATAVLLGGRWRLTGKGRRPTLLFGLAAVPELMLGAWSLARPGAEGTTPTAVVVVVVVVVATVLGALALLVPGSAGLPPWARSSLAAGVLCGMFWSVAGPWALGCSVVGAVLLVVVATTALHLAIEDEKRLGAELQRRLEVAEGALRDDRARLHEITAMVAGIASAQELLTTGISADRSDALSAMMRAEVERLQRLVAGRVRSRRSVDLDEVIGQIVLSHLARGRVVVWQPSGLRAIGHADDIAEIVNVLLENAAVHGGPDAVSVQVTRDPDHHGVVVMVSDQGPGIAPELRDRLFDWGVSGPGSPGQGIGLHVAADLSHELGGRLELLSSATGATFAVHLLAVVEEVPADAPVARAS